MQHTTIVKLSPQGEITSVIAADEEHSNAHGRHRHHHGLGLKKLWKGIKKYNPASVLVRNGALLGFDLNVMGNSMRLYPALITPEQAKTDGIKVEAIEKAKPAWEKVKNLWEKKFGGDVSKLEKAIRRGAKHKVTKMKKKHGADGSIEYYFDDNDYSNVVGAAAVAAGSAVLIAASAIIAKSGAMKKPFEDDSQNGDDSEDGDEPTGGEDSGDSDTKTDDSDDSSSADGVIYLTTNKKIALTGIVLGSIAGLAYAVHKKQNLKDALGYTVAGGLIGFGLEHVIETTKNN